MNCCVAKCAASAEWASVMATYKAAVILKQGGESVAYHQGCLAMAGLQILQRVARLRLCDIVFCHCESCPAKNEWCVQDANGLMARAASRMWVFVIYKMCCGTHVSAYGGNEQQKNSATKIICKQIQKKKEANNFMALQMTSTLPRQRHICKAASDINNNTYEVIMERKEMYVATTCPQFVSYNSSELWHWSAYTFLYTYVYLQHLVAWHFHTRVYG